MVVCVPSLDTIVNNWSEPHYMQSQKKTTIFSGAWKMWVLSSTVILISSVAYVVLTSSELSLHTETIAEQRSPQVRREAAEPRREAAGAAGGGSPAPQAVFFLN